MELDLVPDPGVLPLGGDPIRAVDIAARKVLEKVVAVEPAPPLPKLGDRRPDLVGRGANSNGAGGDEVGLTIRSSPGRGSSTPGRSCPTEDAEAPKRK